MKHPRHTYGGFVPSISKRGMTLISEVRPVDVVNEEDSFAAAQGFGGVVSEARGAGGGAIDVEGAREVEGVIKK
jgi:hypothetical protein